RRRRSRVPPSNDDDTKEKPLNRIVAQAGFSGQFHSPRGTADCPFAAPSFATTASSGFPSARGGHLQPYFGHSRRKPHWSGGSCQVVQVYEVVAARALEQFAEMAEGGSGNSRLGQDSGFALRRSRGGGESLAAKNGPGVDGLAGIEPGLLALPVLGHEHAAKG